MTFPSFDQEKQTYAVDIWGLGIILYSLLVGKAPFDTGNVKTTFGQVQNQNPDYPPNLSGQAMHLLNGMLRKSMGERINLEQTLRHPFFSSSSSGSSPSTSSYSSHLTSDSGIGGGSNNNNTNSSSNAGPYLRGFPEIRQPLLGHIAEAPSSLVGTGSIRKCPSSTRLSATAAPTSSSSKPCPPLSSPLNAERLRASSHHRQELKPGVLGGIAPSGEVTFEFKIPRNKYGLAAIETVTVSCDGLTITVERTDQSECRQVYKHDTLPRTYWQKYNFMSRYVQCVREMTPKVTLYTAQAQCHLMENGPVANFEVNFYSGQKVKFNSGSGRITLQETSDRSSSASYFSYPITRSTDNNALHLLKQFEEWHLQCKTIDKLLTEASPELSVAFPVVIGRRRKEAQLPGGAGGTGVSVSTTVTRATINPRSIMSLSASSQRSYYSPLSPSNYASSR